MGDPHHDILVGLSYKEEQTLYSMGICAIINYVV